MALLLIVFGVLLAIAVWNNQENALFTLLEQDIASSGFLAVLVVMIILSFAANVKAFSTPAKLFGVLLLIVMLITNKGVFSQIKTQISNIGANPLAQAPAAFPAGNPTINLGGSSSSTPLSGATSAVGAVTGIGSLFGF